MFKFFNSFLVIVRWAKDFPDRTLAERFLILRDFLYLRRRKGIDRVEYQSYQMDRQTDAFRDSFLGLNEQRYYLDYLNPGKFYILGRNKYLAHCVLENAGIKMAEVYCYYSPEGRIDTDSSVVASDYKSVRNLLEKKNVSSCVVKATESSHGENIFFVKAIRYLEEDCRFFYPDGRNQLLSELVGDNPLIFEEVVRQTAQMNALNPSSVNTVRMMTTLSPDGTSKVFAAFLKIGRLGKSVDNAGAGGNVDASIDIETGEICHAIQFDGIDKVKEIDSHPDTGAQLNGVVLAHWDEIKQIVNSYQSAFPFLKACGWDIALTDDGPVVIEVNDFWDQLGQLFIRRGWRNEIRNCYLEWKKTGRKYPMGRFRNRMSDIELERIISL